MGGWLRQAAVGACVMVALGSAWAQASAGPGGIYTCVDDKGRRITSDRYIADCTDRQQQVLTTSGTVRSVVPPTLTAHEQAAQDEVNRRKADELRRLEDEKHAQRALVMHYPNKAAHDAERANALRAVDDSAQFAQQNLAKAQRERKKLMIEAEFYKDPATMPPRLKRALQDNDDDQAAQRKILANVDEEKKRINARFDEELARLRVLWAPPLAEGTMPVKR